MAMEKRTSIRPDGDGVGTKPSVARTVSRPLAPSSAPATTASRGEQRRGGVGPLALEAGHQPSPPAATARMVIAPRTCSVGRAPPWPVRRSRRSSNQGPGERCGRVRHRLPADSQQLAATRSVGGHAPPEAARQGGGSLSRETEHADWSRRRAAPASDAISAG